MALRFDGSEWWDTRIANFYEGDSADGSGGSSTGGANSSADGGSTDGTGGGPDSFSGASIADPQGQYGGISGIDTDTGSVSMDFGYDPGTPTGPAVESAPPGSPDEGLGGVDGAPETGFSISQFARSALTGIRGLLSLATNPIGFAMRPGQQVSVAKGMPVGTLDVAKTFADRQNTAGNRAGTVGAIAGSMFGGIPGAAIGETLGRVSAQTAVAMSNPSLASMTTGPMGRHDPEAAAEFSGMVSEAQPGLSNAGGSGSVILDEMRKRSGLPAVAPATYQRPAITSPQARAVYQNR